jgi:hypothetical protein
MENIQKPKNNLALTIVGTVLFWPISLWGLLKAVKVNRLWDEGKHEEAIDASNSARKLGIAGIIVGGIFSVIVFIASFAINMAMYDAVYDDYDYDFYDDYYYDDEEYDYYY